MTIATGRPLIIRIPATGNRELVVVMRGVKQRDWDHLYTGLRDTHAYIKDNIILLINFT